MNTTQKYYKSMTTTVVINAIDYDWGYDTPISLMKIGKETILERLERQIKNYGFKPQVKTNSTKILSSTYYGSRKPTPDDSIEVNGNAIYSKEGFSNAMQGKNATNGITIIETKEDYLTFINKTVNAGKLDDTNGINFLSI